MKNRTLHTDPKLLAAIDGGRAFAMLIDPEGLTGEGSTGMLIYDRRSGLWKCAISFDNGETLLLTGKEHKGRTLIEKAEIPSSVRQTEEIPFKPSETLMDGLGPLSGIPERLKKMLSSEGWKTGIAGRFSFDAYLQLLDNALLWNIEPRNPKEPLRGFSLYRIAYETGENGYALSCDFSVTCNLPEGRITLSAEADIYGLAGKKVVLKKNLGMLRNARIECTATGEDGRTRPSLKAAFDLYDAIPILYEKQRVSKKDRGPRSEDKLKASK